MGGDGRRGRLAGSTTVERMRDRDNREREKTEDLVGIEEEKKRDRRLSRYRRKRRDRRLSRYRIERREEDRRLSRYRIEEKKRTGDFAGIE